MVNTAMIELYWNIGQTILTRQATEPWGNKVLDRLAHDLRAEFPQMNVFSRTNVYHMRAFAAARNGPEPMVQTPSGQLSWRHNVALLNKLDGQELRCGYVPRDVGHVAGFTKLGFSMDLTEVTLGFAAEYTRTFREL
ncbi:hypothetical protein MB46_19320 (plasmid) [Arthrobacter alpinus]|nr:hypothetical protein MB46_19320 [Arthrobacter alpinus]